MYNTNMAETPSTDFEKQAREAVTAGLANAAGPATVQITCQCISRAAQSGADPKKAVVAVVKGVAQAQRAIDEFTKHLTEEEKKSGIFFCWEYTSRRIGRE